jgi:mannosyltransferase
LQIPMAYLIGKRLNGERLGLIFAGLVAASPMLIEFSLELRMYSLVALLALLQVWSFMLVLERNSLARWSLFALIALIGVYTHLHYWLFLIGYVLAFIRERRTLPMWQGMLTLGLIVALYVPNIPNLAVFAQVRGGYYTVHLPSALPKLLAAVTVGYNYLELGELGAGRPVTWMDILENLPLVLLALLPALVVFSALLRLHLRRPWPWVLSLVHERFTVPAVLALLATAVTRQYWLQPKYIIFVAPFALLLLAVGYLEIQRTWLRRATALFTAAVWVIALLHYWNPQEYGRREDWRSAAHLLRESMTPRSALVVVTGGYGLLTYYWPAAPSRWQMVYVPNMRSPSAHFVYSLQERLKGRSDVYYLWYDIQQNALDPRDVLLHSLDHIGTRLGVYHFNPRFKLYHWRLPQPRG